MQRDLKIGLLAGLVIVGAAMAYMCTRPSFSPKEQVLKTVRQQQNSLNPQPQFQQTIKPRESVKTPQLSRQSEPVLPEASAVKPAQSYKAEPKPSFAQPQMQTENYISAEKIKTTRFYIVRSGDTLSKISKKYYGTPDQWNSIYQVNRGVLGGNPNLLRPGTKLIIPE